MSSRCVVVAGALGLALALADAPPARSQAVGSGSAPPAEHDTDRDGDEAPADAGSALIAPADPAARASWLRDRLAAAIALRPTLAPARITFAVSDLATGKDVVAREPDRGMNLASNAKLLTSIAALQALGSGFRWHTAVLGAPPDPTGLVTGDLYLRGRGDPMLTAADLDQLAEDVAARGVRTVEGRLVVDAEYFDAVVEPPHFSEQPHEQAGFRAPIASLLVDRAAITVTILAEPGGRARITLEPRAGDYVKLTRAEVASVSDGRTRLRVDTRTKRDRIEIEATGQIRTGEGSWDIRRRVDDPARFAAEVFRTALAHHGVRLRGRGVAMGAAPATAKVLAGHASPTLADVLRAMNKSSDNNIAECVLKTLGAETKATPGPATWADAVAALRGELARLGLPAGSYRSDNGSGLYASSEVSASQLVTLLAAAHRDYRIGPDLVASLPVGGQDGTLARRWQTTPARGRVRAKTGTLDRVLTLAGFLGVDGGHLVAFAILVNDIPTGQRGTVRAMADDMVDAIAAYLGAR